MRAGSRRSASLALSLALCTSRAWALGTPVDLFGDGADGAFSYSPANTGVCATGCPSQCASCAASGSVCLCKLTANSSLGSWRDNSALISAYYRFTSFTLGGVGQVGVNRTVSNGCGFPDGSMLWIKTQGDMDLGGGAVTRITMVGMGACGASAGTPLIGTGGVGCSTLVNGGGSGGGAGASPQFSWDYGQPEPVSMWGAGGGRPVNAGATACQDLRYIEPNYGGSSGGTGNCSLPPVGCGTATPGHGGGGVILDVGGNLVSASAIVDSSGSACSGQTVGGSGGGSQLVRFRTCDGTTSCSGTFTAAAGTACGAGCTNCNAGGAGGAGVALKVRIVFP